MTNAQLDTPVLILGGGVAGLAAAVDLGRRGVAATVIEREPRLGGRASHFCCKATEACARCGACRLGELMAQAAKLPQITIYTSALAVGAQPQGDGWQVELAPQPGGEIGPGPGRPLAERATLNTEAVILAVGGEAFNPAGKTRFGHGRVEGVFSALELEAMLAQGAIGPEALAPAKVAFIQCVGSRDASLGRLWCSRVCCGYALRMARVIRSLLPESEVTFFHMDVQDYGRAWEDELGELRQDMRFVRAMPGEVTAGEGGPQVTYALAGEQPIKEGFDLVALSVGLGPPTGAPALSELFGAATDGDGFLTGQDGPAGVFVAGAAAGPRSLNESIVHAGLAASQAAQRVASLTEARHG
ncbi:MAG: FAD-dependent oxidoreductase [Deltaproteobacteria bacterium]|nr:FAD-dependent oxidoreductase [Deltaproteobacteria bacterium]